MVASFLFVLLTYLDQIKEKDNIDLISYNEPLVFTNIDSKDILDFIQNESGILILINDKKYTKRIVSLLNKVNIYEDIYLYNIKNDEIKLSLNNEKIEIKQKPTKLYNDLLNILGSYKEYYIIKDKFNNYIKTEYSIIYTPMVLFIKSGNILYSHYLSNEMISDEELINIYENGKNILNKI